jgi:hypothetical protein
MVNKVSACAPATNNPARIETTAFFIIGSFLLVMVENGARKFRAQPFESNQGYKTGFSMTEGSIPNANQRPGEESAAFYKLNRLDCAKNKLTCQA